jgi:Mrp family chromosome partitioning ATPase
MADPHEEKAEELEREADFLEKGGKRVDGMIQNTREDWDSKKSSNQAPGAADPDDAAPGGLGDEDD